MWIAFIVFVTWYFLADVVKESRRELVGIDIGWWDLLYIPLGLRSILAGWLKKLYN